MRCTGDGIVSFNGVEEKDRLLLELLTWYKGLWGVLVMEL